HEQQGKTKTFRCHFVHLSSSGFIGRQSRDPSIICCARAVSSEVPKSRGSISFPERERDSTNARGRCHRGRARRRIRHTVTKSSVRQTREMMTVRSSPRGSYSARTGG